MEMIIGGAYQGKTELAKKRYPEIVWKEGGSLEREELMQAQGVLGFHIFLRRELERGHSLEHLTKELILKNPSVILVSDEVGYGVVPVDAFERSYREVVGRVCTKLAAFSDRVIRVYCGIPVMIKNKPTERG